MIVQRVFVAGCRHVIGHASFLLMQAGQRLLAALALCALLWLAASWALGT
ncbi:hypothetical protein [Variovorax sp. N23]|nr:hypothetical protein [Variovorax sp. N23]MCU4121541.1 hypothetical protein [Variovorax sp. N23]